MSTFEIVFTSIVSLIGAGGLGAAITKLVEGYNKRAIKIVAIEAEGEQREHQSEDSQRIFLQEMIQQERLDHKACLNRITAVEAAMFRQNDMFEKERDANRVELADCHARNGRLQRNFDHVCSVLLKYLPDGPDRESIRSLQPPPHRINVVEVDEG